MFNSAILDVAMGLAFIFLMLSLLVSAICEILAGILKWRAEHLWAGVEQLLQSSDARDALYNHPLVRGLSQLKTSPAAAAAAQVRARVADATAGTPQLAAVIEWAGGHHGPSYIPSRTFALALIDLIREPHQVAASVRQRLETIADDTARNPSQTFAALQKTFDEIEDDPRLDAEQKVRVHALRLKLLAGVDAAVVEPLKAEVGALLGRLSAAELGAMQGVQQWIANAGRAAHYGQLRGELVSAVAMIPDGGPAVGELRVALQGILTRFTLGSPEAVGVELRAFLASSRDVRQALDSAGARFHGLVGALTPLLDDAAGDIDRFRDSIEQWFNDGMDRVGGWYKRHVTMVQAGIGLALALVLNIDALQITRTLWRDPALRQSLTSQAEAYANQPRAGAADPNDLQKYETIRAEIGALGLPVGWRGCGAPAAPASESDLTTPLLWCASGGWDWWGLLPMLLGWTITAASVSLGAPFWFDSLNRIISVRTAGKSPSERTTPSTSTSKTGAPS